MSWLPTVDIIIPCYNVEHIVEKCIVSVKSQQYKGDLQIFLINDGSTDQTGKILAKFSDQRDFSVLHLEQNSGLSTARNKGITAGNGEVIVFLDSDMVVKENWIEEHIRALGEENVVGVIGDSILPKGIKPNTLDKYLYDSRRGARQFGEGTPISFPYFLFNNSSVKRVIFDVVELFDESIKSYGGEDTELAIRLWEAYPDGLRFSFSASSEHYHRRELKDFCQSMYQYGKTNLPTIIEQFPDQKLALGGQWAHSLKGFLLFNPFVRWGVAKIHEISSSFWTTRYHVVDAVIRGVRSISRRKTYL